MKIEYTIHETQNLQSVNNGLKYYGTLFGAKCFATKNQAFQGTTLKIYDEHGIVAVKDKRTGMWYNPDGC